MLFMASIVHRCRPPLGSPSLSILSWVAVSECAPYTLGGTDKRRVIRHTSANCHNSLAHCRRSSTQLSGILSKLHTPG